MRILKFLYRVIVYFLTIISPFIAAKFAFLVIKRQRLNLKNPKTLDEKINWLELYYQNPLITKCSDKYLVRDYVKEIGCVEILNKLYHVYDSSNDIDFNELPDQFVLKCNHDCNSAVFCYDKNNFNIIKTKRFLKKRLKKKMHTRSVEIHYRKIKRKIICEQLIKTKDGRLPIDYKFYCFNGEPFCVLVCVDRGLGAPKFYFMDLDWNLMRINKAGLSAPSNFYIPRPHNFDKMIQYAKKLSSPFPFVRVDLYDENGNIIFGELTFTPSGGKDSSRLRSTDLFFGKMLVLPNKKITGNY